MRPGTGEPLIIGVPIETYPGERRVAVVPGVLSTLSKDRMTVVLETGAGRAAGFPDAAYRDKGAQIASSRGEVFERADVVVQVRALGANRKAGKIDDGRYREGQAVIGLCDPLGTPDSLLAPAARGAAIFSLELLPRITRAQPMDALSSMSTVAGYKAVLLAAAKLPRMFPLLMTAAGRVSPSRVFVVGAGVAGLTAIATARRLGAVVEAYDVRAAVKEQVESVGAKFLEIPLPSGEAETQGGYAKTLDEEVYRRQREMMARALAASDVVITTAQVPGKKAPLLITKEMVSDMAPGSVIVDLAAEQGGNCALTRAGETVAWNGVVVLGPVNLPATVPRHASQMYAKNIVAFLRHVVRDGTLPLDRSDEITRETLVAQGGEVIHPRVRAALGLPAEGEVEAEPEIRSAGGRS